LDQQRVAEIESKDSEIKGKHARVTALEDALSRKHPHDAHLERTVYDAVAKLTGQEITFLGWLLDHGRAGNSPIQASGFRGIPSSVAEKTGHFLITFESYRPGDGAIETDRFYYINPTVRDVLKNTLYPPRPVPPSTTSGNSN
jgi:hypothetical protein